MLWLRNKDTGEELSAENIYDLIDIKLEGDLRLESLQMNKLEKWKAWIKINWGSKIYAHSWRCYYTYNNGF